MTEAKDRVEAYVLRQQQGEIPRGSMLESLCLFYKWLMLELCMIRDFNADIVPLKPNTTQYLLLYQMMQQAENEQPVRVVVLKARKVGVTTFVQALFFFLCAHNDNHVAVTIGHETTATRKIFDITKRIGKHYQLMPTKDHHNELRFPSLDSCYYCATAGGQAPGAGDTPNYLHLTEIPKWPRKGEQTDYTSTESIPDNNDKTIIVYESTAQGRELFWQKFKDAHREDNEYRPLFAAWYLDDRKVAPVPKRRKFEHDEDEKRLLRQAHSEGIELSNEQLMWRRKKIASMTGGIALFRQEYPSTPEEAVQAVKGLVIEGMRQWVIDKLPCNPESTTWDQRVGGIDAGFYDATVIISALLIDQVVYIYDIYHAVERTSSDHVTALREGYTYWIDPTAVSSREEMLDKCREDGTQLSILSAPRLVRPREDPTITEFRRLMTWISQGHVRILRDCAERLLIETDSLIWDERTGKPDLTRGPQVGHYDTVMALRYLSMGVLKRLTGEKPTKKKKILRPVSRRASLRAI